MKRAILLFALVATAAAQAIPGRYIVEFQTDPAVRVAASKKAHYSPLDADVVARRAQIRSEHAAAVQAIHALGGTIVGRYDTAFNGLAIKIADSAVAQVKALPGVVGVFPDKKRRPTLDHAVAVHRIIDTWAALPGGQASAGAGIKIAILDIGIDAAHPGFQGFSTPMPAGFPIACDYSLAGSGDLGSCVNNSIELANTNSKVIVSRDYSGTGGVDTDGHGTGNAMIAAGLTNMATLDYVLSDGVTILPIPIAPITGAAPGAWLGNYKVCSDDNGGFISWFLQAVEDAINDGMNVINYSVGGSVTDSAAETTSPEAQTIANALAAGVPVVVAAGDDGFNPNGGQSAGTIAEPAVAQAAIAVGAIGNSRFFYYAVNVANQGPIEAEPPNLSQDINFADIYDPMTGSMTDVATIDGSGYACGTLPNGSLNGQIALIRRGGVPAGCAFDVKLNNAQNAGAIAAIVYDNKPNELLSMELTTTTLPGIFVALADGQNLQTLIAANPGLQATIDFTGFTSFPTSANVLAIYSPAGPTPSGNIKPDVLGVGGYDPSTGDVMLTADATINAPDPYTIEAGTSFAAPLVTGSIAVLMAARPGLTGTQYKSLVVNSAPLLNICDDGSLPSANTCADGTTPFPALIQTSGTGRLDLLNAMGMELAASPTAVNFQTASGSVATSQALVVTNVGAASDTFTVAVNPVDGMLTPAVDTPTFNLAPGASQTINVSLAGSNLAPGTLNDGYVVVNGTQGSAATSVPYWFGVAGTEVQNISLLDQNFLNGGFPPRSQVPIYVRYVDAIGLPIAGPEPTVTISGGAKGRVLDVIPLGDIPGTFEIDVQLDNGAALGYDPFIVTIGSTTLEVDIPISN